MKNTCFTWTVLGAAGALVAALTLSPAAQARTDVHWSVGIGAPGVAVGVGTGYPVYAAPAPVYVQPQPIYVQPRPVYVQPRPVYAAPPVYYGAPVVVRPPVLVAPPVYPIGWGQGRPWRHHHRHWRGQGWRY